MIAVALCIPLAWLLGTFPSAQLVARAKGVDITAVSRRDQTVADMANGPYQRVSPFPATVKLLESLGSKNNNRCVSC